MPNENKELTHCPNCPRHCPKEALSCERGIRFFDQDEPGDSGFGSGKDHHHGHHAEHHGGPRFFESESKNPLVLALSKASAIAEHKSQMMRAHGKDEGTMFSVLTEEEQKELSSLLDKLLDQWAKAHAAHHSEKGCYAPPETGECMAKKK